MVVGISPKLREELEKKQSKKTNLKEEEKFEFYRNAFKEIFKEAPESFKKDNPQDLMCLLLIGERLDSK